MSAVVVGTGSGLAARRPPAEITLVASRPLRIFQAASAVTRVVPLDALSLTASGLARQLGPRIMPDKVDQLARHIQRVNPGLDEATARAAAARGLGSYARYWVESFKLPHASTTVVDRGFSVIGYEHVEASLTSGLGPILVLPHLGGWEWAAAWLGKVVGVRVSAVVERLEPDDVFEWFVDLRSAYGIDVIPLGPDAIGRLATAVHERNIVCLLSDRDIDGTGVEVSFFGENTTLPAGPALLARRTGAPLLPTAVYFRGRSRLGYVDPAIRSDPDRRLRADVKATTQALAHAMERLIEAAPEQWHMLGPNWPSDHDQDHSPEPTGALERA
ncbi:MAG: phosphatidylinositol mannoside acyltransferase [Actinomycetota bacterium]